MASAACKEDEKNSKKYAFLFSLLGRRQERGDMETQLFHDRFAILSYDDARDILELRWLPETEAMTGPTRSISPSSNKECMCRSNEGTPGIPLAQLSGANCGLAMRRD